MPSWKQGFGRAPWANAKKNGQLNMMLLTRSVPKKSTLKHMKIHPAKNVFCLDFKHLQKDAQGILGILDAQSKVTG